MMKTILLGMVLAVAAHADLSQSYTTKWYMEHCARAFRLEVDADGIDTTVTDTSDETAFCAGMLEGVWETVGRIHPDRAIALGQIYQLNAIVARWLKAHPEKVDEEHRAAGAMFDALTEAVAHAVPELVWEVQPRNAPKQ